MFTMFFISLPLRKGLTDMQAERTTYLVGNIDAGALAAAYSCGHCSSDTSTHTDDDGITHVAIHHDDGCPVLNGALSALPDTLRAIVPDTFRL